MAKQKKQLSIGVIGLGGIGQGTIRLCPQLDYFNLVAGADPSPKALDQAAEVLAPEALFTDYRTMLQEVAPDMVFIATPNAFHAPAAIAAMEAGCDVMCEKPMADSLAAAKRIHQASLKTGKKFMIGQNQRFRLDTAWLRARIEEGVLGEIYALHTRWLRRHPYTEGMWFREKALSGGGPLIDLGVHVMDMALWLAGFPEPQRICAQAGQRLIASGDVEDWAFAMVRLAGGGTLTCEVMEKGFIDQEVIQVEIRGTKGGVMIDGNAGTTIFSTQEGAPVDLKPRLDPDHGGARERELNNFAEWVLFDKAPRVPVEQSLQIQAILEGVYRSAQQGKEIAVPAW
ncbi:MAG TPA: Gfo/Idh/MocA family oxidoreductase [Armatimonadota bacterium]|jgi:predicted dehydrogenase